MASLNCTSGMTKIVDRTIDYVAGTIKARLVASSATPAKTDMTMTGKTALCDDVALGSKSIVADQVNGRTVLKCGALTFAAVPVGPTAGWIGVYADGATDADRVPLTWIDTSDLPGNGGDMTYTPPTVDGEANVLTHLTV